MVKKLFALVLFFLLVAAINNAQEKAELKIEELVLCTAVQERKPVGVDTVFADTVKKVYCFTKISGAADTTSISHVWYFKDEEKANIKLSVKAKTWRTWSTKNIPKEWDGKWRIDVKTSDGTVLKSKEFIIRTTSINK